MPVHDRRLTWLLGSSALSNLGDGVGKVAFPLLAASITRDPVLIAGLSATTFLPWLLFAALSGVLVDRVDRRRAMIVANVTRAALIAGLGALVIADAVSIWLIYAAALLVGTVETVADSAANALIPAVVPRQGLESANSKLQSVEIVGQTFLGGPLGGVLFAVFAAAPFLLNSAGFLVAALLLAGLAGSYRPAPQGPRESVAESMRAGLRWVRSTPLMVRLVAFAALMALTSEIALALLVLYVLQDLGASEAMFGVFALVGGAGGLLGAAVATRLTARWPRRAVLVGSVLAAGAAFVSMAPARGLVLGSVLFGVFAAAMVVVNVILGGLRHALVPEHLFGRVIGVWRTVVWGAIPIGALIGGLLATTFGTRTVFAVAGALQLALAGAIWLALAAHHREIDILTAEQARDESAEPDRPTTAPPAKPAPAPSPKPVLAPAPIVTFGAADAPPTKA